MKTHASEWAGLRGARRFLFCSEDNAVAAQLAQALGEEGTLMQETPAPQELARRVAEISPSLVFVDFTPSADEPGKLAAAADLVRLLAQAAPEVARVAVGRLSQPEGAVAALRAGVSDFVDPAAAPEETRQVARRLMAAPGGNDAGQAGRSLLLLGARPGVGTSTLAVHLAGIVQGRLQQAHGAHAGARAGKAAEPGEGLPLAARVAVADLGWPVGDCQLYLNIKGDFHFAEAARNLKRLDATLLGSVLPRSASGLSVLALPRDVEQMREVSLADSLLVFERLRQHCGAVLTDAGGFSNAKFIAALARVSQYVWLVTDQSVGALVSLAGLLQDLERLHVERARLGLVVNRYDERYGMTAQQIAERFGLALVGTLPERTLALMTCTNQGRLLHEEAERDIYVRGVQALADRLCAEAHAARAGWLASWLQGMPRWPAAH